MTRHKIIIASLIFFLLLFSIFFLKSFIFKTEIDNGIFPGFYFPFRGNFKGWKNFDENGIVYIDYGGNIGNQYNPTTVAQYALENYNFFIKTGLGSYKSRFLNHVDWLVQNQIITDYGCGVWYYNFDYRKYKCKAPWISGIAQGQAISVLIRAYLLTQNQEYFDCAKLALRVFENPVEEGGVRYIDVDKNVFYLEYPCGIFPRVLNGFVFALVGLKEFYLVSKDKKVLKLFNDGVKTLINNIDKYDSGDWSLSDLNGRRASPSYHTLHCRLMFLMYSLTKEDIFLEYGKKWSSYIKE